MKKNNTPKTVHIRSLLRNSMITTVLILLLGALAAGITAYFLTIETSSANSIRSIVQAMTWYLDEEEGRQLRDEVVRINSRVGREEITDTDFDAMTRHTPLFSELAEEKVYTEMLSLFEEYSVLIYNVESIYYFWYDEENERAIHIIDSFNEGGPYEGVKYPLGTMESIRPVKAKRSDLSVNSRVVAELEGGNRLVLHGFMPWYDLNNELLGYIGVDISRQDFIRGGLFFFIQTALLMIFIGIIATMFIVWRGNRKMQPIIDVTNAAERYAEYGMKPDGRGDRGFFSETDGGNVYEFRRLVETLQTMEDSLEQNVRELTDVTRENERINTELTLAAAIQTNVLPSRFPPYPDRKEFELYAKMDPAREVGGDFYDFYLLDDDHLALVMADVSGKGIPASLFMMSAKIMIKNRAMYGGGPAEILAIINDRICRENQSDMFVTVWLGIVELSTGHLTAANAGHEYPVLRRAGRQFELLRDRHGLVLGAMEGASYKTYELDLHAGDILYLYTDGVTEAEDPDQKMFGSQRMLEALNRAGDASAEEIIKEVRSSVDRFAKGAEQFDDITQLCFRYYGKEEAGKDNMKTILFEAKTENLDKAMAFLEEELEKSGVGPAASMQLQLAFEELFVNVAHYAYETTGSIRIGYSCENGTVTLQFTDEGVPFDPFTEAGEPDFSLPAEKRPIGGLGIYMVKQSMDEYSYRYENGHNIVTIRKKVTT